MTLMEPMRERRKPGETDASSGKVTPIAGSSRPEHTGAKNETSQTTGALPTVCVVGDTGMQNRLLVDLLDQSGACRCRVVGVDEVPEITEPHIPQLVLVDVLSGNYGEIIKQFSSPADPGEGPVFGLINVQCDQDVEPFLFWKEVHGVFRADTRPEVLVRGVENMLAGNYWFPRGALDHLLDQTRNALKDMNGAIETLTRREQTVLEALAEGASNEAIADRLCISPHTVKSHLYNLFRKIEVSNRVEAAIWARRYLTYRGP